jgi:hypothetical protein
MDSNLYDNQFNITIESFTKKIGSSRDRIYLKLLEYKYGIQPATEAEWYARLDILKRT